MRIAKSRYDSAVKRLEELKNEQKAYEKTVRQWEKAVKEIGSVGDGKEIVAVNSTDGEWWAEVKKAKDATDA